LAIGFLQDQAPDSNRMDGPLLNVLTGMGTSNDRSQATGIQGGRALGEAEINALYEQSWLLRRVVEKIPMQGTRSGWDLGLGDETTTTERSKLDDLVSWTEELKLPQAVTTAATYARLYGGGALVVLADDRTPIDKPLNLKRLRSIKGFYPIDRWRLYPSAGWTGIGSPESYWFETQQDRDLTKASGDPGLADALQVDIHASRIIRFEGLPCSWRTMQSRQWWGLSVVDLCWDVFKRFETGQQSAADILHDFDLVVHTLPNLQRILDAGGEQKLRERLRVNSMARSVYGAYVLGEGETLANLSRSAAGIADILEGLKGEITGASGLPHTILWGESPSGMGADGRSEQAAFGNDVADWQDRDLRPPLRRAFELAMACSDGPWKGKDPPESWAVEFRPNYTPTEDEQADLRGKVANADVQYIQAGVLSTNEVALARFGKPRFSLTTTLIDREEDGSLKQPEPPAGAAGDESEIEFGGSLAEQEADPGGAPPDPEEEPPSSRGDQADACCDDCEARSQELALSITANRRRRKQRKDAPAIPRADAAGDVIERCGVNIRIDSQGLGRILAPYGQELPHPVAVGPDISGAWEVFEPSTGAYLLAIGHQHVRGIRDSIGPGPTIRQIDGTDLVALGARCDAYS